MPLEFVCRNRDWGVACFERHAVAAWVFLCFSPLVWSENSDSVPARPGWKVGNGWHVRLTYNPRLPGDAPGTNRACSYDMHVVVTGTQKSGGSDCWQLDFVPATAVPPEVGGPYRVLLNKDMGQVEKVQLRKTLAELKLSPQKGVPRGLGLLPGIPAEVLPLFRWESPLGAAGKAPLQLEAQVLKDSTWLQATVEESGKERLRVRQRWVACDPWWQEYEFWRDGHKELTAARIPGREAGASARVQKPADPKLSGNEPQGTDSGLPLAVWLARHPAGSEVDAADLQDDPRLRAPLTGMLKSPTVPELLVHLEAVTGLTLTCQPATPPPSPVFGNPHFHQTPAYVVMKQMATSGPGKGRWQSTADGYHLVLDDPTVAERLLPAPERSGHPLLIFLSLGGGGLVLVTGWFLLSRAMRQRAKHASAVEV